MVREIRDYVFIFCCGILKFSVPVLPSSFSCCLQHILCTRGQQGQSRLTEYLCSSFSPLFLNLFVLFFFFIPQNPVWNGDVVSSCVCESVQVRFNGSVSKMARESRDGFQTSVIKIDSSWPKTLFFHSVLLQNDSFIVFFQPATAENPFSPDSPSSHYSSAFSFSFGSMEICSLLNVNALPPVIPEVGDCEM